MIEAVFLRAAFHHSQDRLPGVLFEKASCAEGERTPPGGFHRISELAIDPILSPVIDSGFLLRVQSGGGTTTTDGRTDRGWDRSTME